MIEQSNLAVKSTMNPDFSTLLWLVFGWLFGLLTPGIAERIKRKHRQAEVVRAVKGELNELQYMMAIFAYTMRSRSAEITDEFLEWLRPIVRSYQGSEVNIRFAEMLELSRTWTEEQRQQADAALYNPERAS